MNSGEQSTPAVVLRTTAIGEADLMLSVLTPLRGRLELRANGARKSRRRFPGGLPVGARGNATIAGRGSRGAGQVQRLVSFEPRADSSAIGRDLESFAYTAYLCELADQLVSGTQADPRVFAALVDALEQAISGPRPVVMRTFELRLLDALGHLPALDHCAICGDHDLREDEGRVAFDLGRGGALCRDHAHLATALVADGGASVSVAVRNAALSLVHEDLENVDGVMDALSPVDRRELRDLMLRVVRGHLRRPLRSSALFAQLVPSAKGRGGGGG